MKKHVSHGSCYDNHKQQQQKKEDDANERSLTSDEQKKNIGCSISLSTMFKCDLCHRIFTSGTALGGHKSHHHLQPLTKKQKHNVLDDHSKQKHECLDYDKVFPSNMRSHREKGSSKGIESPTTSFPVSFLCDLDQFQVDGAPPAINLSKYLPPSSHKKKKRSIVRRNMIDHELLNAAHILLDMSRGGGGGDDDDDDHTPKRLKLSSNVTDNDNLQKQDSGDIDETPGTKVKGINKNNKEKSLVLRFKIQPSSSNNDTGETPDTRVKVPYNNTKKSLVLRFKIPRSLSTDNKILQTSEGCSQHGSIDIEEMKKSNEGETRREQSHKELKSERVVRNFDLNELPTNGVSDE